MDANQAERVQTCCILLNFVLKKIHDFLTLKGKFYLIFFTAQRFVREGHGQKPLTFKKKKEEVFTF